MKNYIIGVYVGLVKIKQIVVNDLDLANSIISEIEDDVYSTSLGVFFYEEI
jgi:hypothetical protein